MRGSEGMRAIRPSSVSDSKIDEGMGWKGREMLCGGKGLVRVEAPESPSAPATLQGSVDPVPDDVRHVQIIHLHTPGELAIDGHDLEALR